MPSKLNFIRDYYCTTDKLGFDLYVHTLAEMIADKNFKTPFCIGIQGPWGSGKTSFMRQLEATLVNNETNPVAIPVWFNPWRYSKEEHLIIPFLKTISAALLTHQKTLRGPNNSQLKDSLKKAAKETSTAARAMAYGVKVNFFGLALSGKDMIEQEQKLKENSREDFARLTEELPEIYYSIIEHLQKAVDDPTFRLVVFIDDLDRCLPEKAVELLEAIKLFLDIKGYLFILGVDRAVVEEGIRQHYQYKKHKTDKSGDENYEKELAGKYLEKMIQMGLDLPPIEPSRKRSFINQMLEGSSLKDHGRLIELGITGRPRDIIRFINFLAFFCRLAENLKKNFGEEPDEEGKPPNWADLREHFFSSEFYIKWAIFVFSYRAEYLQTIDVTDHFFQLQNAARLGANQLQKKVHLPPGLGKVLAYGEPISEEPWLIRKYVHLTNSVSDVIPESPTKGKIQSQDKNLPSFGSMTKVQRGPFLYGEEKETRNIKEDFEIDVYPITNKQFCEYLNQRYQGKRLPQDSQKNTIIMLGYSEIKFVDHFDNEKEFDNHPVTGVTWYGAVDFCEWRTEKATSNSEVYRLPTELEWEKAARGDNGREYPWGKQFSQAHCNTLEPFEDGTEAVNGTTNVNLYPKSKSPYGCFDMIGNVWEWTLDDYDEDTVTKALRGGSWSQDSSYANCTSRYGDLPTDARRDVGFRCTKVNH